MTISNRKDKQNMAVNIIGGGVFVHQAITLGLLPVLTLWATSIFVEMEYMADQGTVVVSDQLYG